MQGWWETKKYVAIFMLFKSLCLLIKKKKVNLKVIIIVLNVSYLILFVMLVIKGGEDRDWDGHKLNEETQPRQWIREMKAEQKRWEKAEKREK